MCVVLCYHHRCAKNTAVIDVRGSKEKTYMRESEFKSNILKITIFNFIEYFYVILYPYVSYIYS